MCVCVCVLKHYILSARNRSRQSNASDTVRQTHEMSQHHLCHNIQIYVCGREREKAIYTHTVIQHLRLKSSSAEMKEEAVWIWDFVSSGTGINTHRLEYVRADIQPVPLF